jgi:DNA-binding Lrp family transcriptional regulator
MAKEKKEFSGIKEPLRELKILQRLEENSHISQRELSRKVGIALGVTNACLKKMVEKGLIKIKGVNHKRIGYYLTPKGFQEKSRLTYNYLKRTVHFYLEAKQEISAKLEEICAAGAKTVVFCGTSDLMEIAYITLQGVNLKFLGIVDEPCDNQKVSSVGVVVQPIEAISRLKPDAVLLTRTEDSQKVISRLRNVRAKGTRIYTLLGGERE